MSYSTTPTISVIICAYNTEKYIAKAIQSALDQTFQDIEIIVVNDASTDQTAQVAKNFSDQRVKVFTLPENSGASVARNYAIQQAKGEWLALLDSDDWYSPERLETLLEVAEQFKDADFIADDLYYIEDGADQPLKTILSENDQNLTEIIEVDAVNFVKKSPYQKKGLPLGGTKPIIRRDFLLKHDLEYDKSLRMGQDFWFYLTCLAHGAKFVFLPKPYYFQRLRSGSLITQGALDRLEYYCQANRDFLKKDILKENPSLKNALENNLRELEQFQSYYKVVQPLKQKQFFLGCSKMIENPNFFTVFFQRIPDILMNRINKISFSR
ncbi:MAG: glycosyltransferase family 2 protein [Halothece sp.]